jgi:hypothetical protein
MTCTYFICGFIALKWFQYGECRSYYKPVLRQLAAPIGYLVTEYGPWPRAGCWVLKARVPPSWKSTRSPGNFHTVTLLLAHERQAGLNPLLMPEGLEQIHDWWCDCAAGKRTNASCCHRDAVLALLCATATFNSAKVPEAATVDTARYLMFKSLFGLTQLLPHSLS